MQQSIATIQNTSERQHAHRPRILLAEDDDDLRQLILGVLEYDGYHAVGLASGLALLTEFQAVLCGEEPPALVISDERMPGMTGLRVLQKARDWGVTLPLVLITASGDDELAGRAKKLGVIVMNKPFDMDDLRTLVGWLAPRRGMPAPMPLCASCGNTSDLFAADNEGQVFFCRECLEVSKGFHPDDPFVDLGVVD